MQELMPNALGNASLQIYGTIRHLMTLNTSRQLEMS